MDNFQRVGSMSNSHVGRAFTAAVKGCLLERGLHLQEEFALNVGFLAKKQHKFDLGSDEAKVLVECKSYTWTSGGNTPSAKIRGLNEAMLLFSVTPVGWRKILVMTRHLRGEQSLAEHYLRTQGHLIGHDVELWELEESERVMRRLV